MGALESRIRDVEGGIAATRQQDAANDHFRGGYRYDELIEHRRLTTNQTVTQNWHALEDLASQDLG
jgi:hypothetical protein